MQEVLGVAMKWGWFLFSHISKCNIHGYIDASMSALFTQTQWSVWSVPVWLCERLGDLKRCEISCLWLQSCGQTNTTQKWSRSLASFACGRSRLTLKCVCSVRLPGKDFSNHMKIIFSLGYDCICACFCKCVCVCLNVCVLPRKLHYLFWVGCTFIHLSVFC